MKVFIAPFLLIAADGARVLRDGGSSRFTMREYLFDDGLVDDNTDSDGRKLESCCEPIGYRKYELKEVFEVEGRQGIATNGTHYFNSGSTALYTYDMEGKLLKKNEE